MEEGQLTPNDVLLIKKYQSHKAVSFIIWNSLDIKALSKTPIFNSLFQNVHLKIYNGWM